MSILLLLIKHPNYEKVCCEPMRQKLLNTEMPEKYLESNLEMFDCGNGKTHLTYDDVMFE